MTFELLLSHAGDGQAVLRHGLGEKAFQSAPRPLSPPLPSNLWDTSREPNLLPRQRWGLVVPEGTAGKKLLELVEPLRRLREAEQGGVPPRIYYVPPDLEGQRASLWKKHTFRPGGEDEGEVPRYVLVLGDPAQVSLELQRVLASDAYVGRLAFDEDAGYEAYVNKVLRWARAPAGRARMLVYTARDGTDATELGYQALIKPGLESCVARQQHGRFPKAEIREVSELEHAPRSGPSVLFSLSHGLGPPRGGWSSTLRQRECQGALKLHGGAFLTGSDIASRPFLPGGAWFCFVCFSGGTPASSTYAPWLRQLAETSPEAERVLATLPLSGQRPFIAALPQAALANPEGPLVVVGHVDLAWAYSFIDEGQRRFSRFFEVLRALLEGSRAGPSLRALLDSVYDVNSELTLLSKEKDVDPLKQATLWMQRHDLENYVLLGDPAVRLPVTVSD